MIRVTDDIGIDDAALSEEFIRSSGPGGQNVNKVSTAVMLRCDLRRSGLPGPLMERLKRIAGKKVTAGGILVIVSRSLRTQDANRKDALERLKELVIRASVEPSKRRPTKATRASKERRLDEKRKKGGVKKGRGRVKASD